MSMLNFLTKTVDLDGTNQVYADFDLKDFNQEGHWWLTIENENGTVGNVAVAYRPLVRKHLASGGTPVLDIPHGAELAVETIDMSTPDVFGWDLTTKIQNTADEKKFQSPYGCRILLTGQVLDHETVTITVTVI